MLKACIKPTLLPLFTALVLSGCGAFSGAPQPEVSDKVKASYNKALRTMKAGKTQLAIKQFKRVAKLQPNIAGPHINLGMLYLKLNSLEQAQHSLEKAIELNPKSTIAHNYLGIVYRSQGRFDEAERAYLTALNIDNQYDYAHLNLGILYDLYKTDYTKALSHYQQYLELADKPDKNVEKWVVDIQRRSTAKNQKGDNKG